MSDNPTKYEVLIEKYLRSILDISERSKSERVSLYQYTAELSFPSPKLLKKQLTLTIVHFGHCSFVPLTASINEEW